MQALMIAPQPFFEPRGTPISVHQRLVGLTSLGHQVDLVTYHIGADVDIPGVNINRIPPISFIKAVPIGPSWAKLLLDIFLFLKAAKMLMAKRYDVIHTHEEAAFMALLLSLIFRVPHVYDMHSSLPAQLVNFQFGNFRPIIRLFERLERLVLETCDVVITVGEDLEMHVLKASPSANHIRIENLVIDSNIQHESSLIAGLRHDLGLDGKLPVVYTGNLERYQGLDLLLESAQLVLSMSPNVVFVIVGGTEAQVAHWKDRARQLQVAEAVTFVGSVTLAESLRHLQVAEILVSPRTEGLSVPLKLYSYLKSGKPIVATDVNAHAQILDGEISVLVEANPEAFSKGILLLVRNADLRTQIGNQAKAFAEREFSREVFLAKLERAYVAAKLGKPVSEIPNSEVMQRIHSVVSILA